MSQIHSPNSNNVSVNSSYLEVSTDTFQKRADSQAREKERDEHMARMIRNGSY